MLKSFEVSAHRLSKKQGWIFYKNYVVEVKSEADIDAQGQLAVSGIKDMLKNTIPTQQFKVELIGEAINFSQF